jgi:hypothetical protein
MVCGIAICQNARFIAIILPAALGLFAAADMLMSNAYTDGMHFVEIRHGASRELWVTAGPRKEAVANVLRHFSSGHVAELSHRRVTNEEASRLKLKNGEACVYDEPGSDRRRRPR